MSSGQLTPALRERIENTIRFLAIDAVEAAKSGHPGAPMGLAGPVFELWDQHLRFDPSDPQWPLRDRFILSNGHASMLLYALLHLFGYDLPLEEIKRFRQLHSRTPGHPEYGDTPGVEVTTGPLGQGFAMGVGMALAARMTRARFARGGFGPGQHFIYGVVSDGDLMEGISAEAASLAGHLGLGNLIYLYDDNRITIDGPTTLSFSEDVARRFEAQRWQVQRVDAEDSAGLRVALDAARAEGERPSLILLRTTIGYGSPGKAGSSKVHGAPLGPEEAVRTRENLGWPAEPHFWIPDDVTAYCDARVTEKQCVRRALDSDLAHWCARDPELAAEWDRCRAQAIPDDLQETLAAELEGVEAATRKHSSVVIQRAAAALPWLVGGSADLAESNLTRIETGGDVGPAAGKGNDPFVGRNLHFGVREHAMGAITNGLALDGTFRPYAGTFLIFSDYLRPALRLSALMRLRTLFVFTHDSIFLGEDGPTHQPIEHLDSLRAIPGLCVLRPADSLETAYAWTWALRHAQGPVVLVLTRQSLPALKREGSFGFSDFCQGAYAVVDPGPQVDVVLAASGSEVSLACAAAVLLRAEAITARVVSLPSLELFRAQPAALRERLLPAAGTPVVAIEAARGESYWPLVGARGAVFGIERFGASAPQKALAEAFGFTAEAVKRRVLEHLRSC